MHGRIFVVVVVVSFNLLMMSIWTPKGKSFAFKRAYTRGTFLKNLEHIVQPCDIW